MAQHTCETCGYKTMSAKRMTHHQNQTRHGFEKKESKYIAISTGKGTVYKKVKTKK